MSLKSVIKVFIGFEAERIKEEIFAEELIGFEVFPAEVINLNVEALFIGYVGIERLLPQNIKLCDVKG